MVTTFVAGTRSVAGMVTARVLVEPPALSGYGQGVGCAWPLTVRTVQLPEAVHEVALVEDQVTVEILPAVMLVGLAENATVGGAISPPEFPPDELPPAGYALFDPGKTGTPPGTSTNTILTLLVTMG